MQGDDKTPAKTSGSTSEVAQEPSSKSDIDAFLSKVSTLAPVNNAGKQGRLIFAMDATMSRQPTWDMALGIQAGMFDVVKERGGLDIQLVYFRGFNECRASKWAKDPKTLARLMGSVSCQGGHTQIGRVLRHAKNETENSKVNALVYVGDCVEEEIDDLAAAAGELGLLGIPMFIFQEGHNQSAETAFRELARLTNGAYSRFNAGAADELRALLSAVAVYAAGGKTALEDLSKSAPGARALLEQLR